MKNIGLVPLINFAQVNHHIWRCAQPLYSYQYQWLKEVVEIDVIVNLRSESHHDDYMGEQFGMQVYNMSVFDHQPPSGAQVRKFENIIKTSGNKKVLIHCAHGHGRTSTFCVIAQIAEGMSLEDALKEETEKFHYHFRHRVQEDFLRQYYNHKKQPV